MSTEPLIPAPSDATAPPERVVLKDLSLAELEVFVVTKLGERKFRAPQIFRWIHQRGVRTFSEMTDLSASLRARLDELAEVGGLTVDAVHVSKDGTKKLLLRLKDGSAIEAVLIPDDERLTLCVSTQVGCALACAFCATGKLGLLRHLTPGEIVDQVLRAGEIAGGPREITNIVLMGMGEPLHNYDGTMTALRNLCHEHGLNFSPRRITLSTVGLIPEMLRLGDELPVKLAVSLHAADNETRAKIMPINKKYDLDALIAACHEFPMPTRNACR